MANSDFYANIPTKTYAVTWLNDETELVEAHAVVFPRRNVDEFVSRTRTPEGNQHISFFASINGSWTTVLSAQEGEIRKVRLIAKIEDYSVLMVAKTEDYGILTDYTTGEEIRPATHEEWQLSELAGETGVFELEGRSVFVAGGSESESTEDNDSGEGQSEEG